jgi:hypothetical protein
MTTALLEPPLPLFGEARSGPAGGRRLTLEERLESVLRSALTEGVAQCPVCRAGMHREEGAVRCSRCGSTLS